MIVTEVKRTIGTWWCKEMTNLNMKTFGVSFFCYLACVAPAITFGAVYSGLVGNWMGPTETLVATAWTGIMYALVGGMPTMINGGTGPVLAFTAVLYQLSIELDVPFLTFRAWIGLWICFYMVVVAVFDLNRYVHLATRFTDEIFSLLIAVIFIVNALYNFNSEVGILHYFNPCHKWHRNKLLASMTAHCEVPGDGTDASYSYLAAGMLSVLVCFGTTVLAMKLKSIKASPYFFGPKTRGMIGDFAVVAAAATFIFIDRVVFKDVQSETLHAPDQLEPSFACCDASCRTFFPDDCPGTERWGARPWLVDFMDLNGNMWIPFFAAVPALLGFLLLFLDNGITWHLINSPSYKLAHGQAYNYDTVVVGIAVAVNSAFGLPWLCAATVRSVNHLLALAEMDDTGKAISHVQETRLTHLLIHVMIAATVFCMQMLKNIPMAVLYGIFLYMGVTSLTGNQFYERVHMLFMQPNSVRYPKRHYNEPYVSRLPLSKYTIFQMAIFVLLYAVKSMKSIAILFPIVIGLCVPFRCLILPKLFTKEQLTLLDGEDQDIKELVASMDGKATPLCEGKDVEEGAPAEKNESGLSANKESMAPPQFGGTVQSV